MDLQQEIAYFALFKWKIELIISYNVHLSEIFYLIQDGECSTQFTQLNLRLETKIVFFYLRCWGYAQYYLFDGRHRTYLKKFNGTSMWQFGLQGQVEILFIGGVLSLPYWPLPMQ